MDVAVLGADATGRAIAHCCARSGHPVSLHSHDATIVMDSIDIIERQLDDAETRGDITEKRRDETVDRLEATTGLDAAVSNCDVVIETTLDTEAVLQERFAEIEQLVGRETLVASASPSVSVTAVAAGLRHPDRALGLHFNRPLDRPLVEIIVAEQTTIGSIERAESFVDAIASATATVRDTPGTASIRLLLAQELEAMRMVADGVASVSAIDDILIEGYDHPIGPLERADRESLDDRLEWLDFLTGSLGPRFEPPALLAQLIAEGNTGMDAGEGFYVWEDGEPVESALSDPTLAQPAQRRDDPGRDAEN